MPPATTQRLSDRSLIKIVGGSVAAMAAAFGLVLWTVVAGFNDQDHQRDQHTIDNFYIGCLRGNQQREAEQFILNLSAGSRVDYTKVPGYAALPASFRQFLTNLTPKDGAPSSFKEQALAKVKDRDCEKAYSTHTKGLMLSPEG